MSLTKTILSSATALAILTGVAHAAVENDGKGDYLLAPAYYALANWETTLKVVNTNTTHAIVAKVVVREHNDSREIMDFPIYLTPGDVWDGTLKENASGNIILVSTDDSMILKNSDGSMNQASAANPIIIDNDIPGGINSVAYTGYVEIFGASAYPAGQFDTAWKEGKALSKSKFFTLVRDSQSGLPADLNTTGSMDVTDSLIGKQTITAEATADAAKRFMALNMLALEGVATSSSDGLTLGVGKTTSIVGPNTTLALLAEGTATRTMMNTDLSKDKIFVMYEGNGDAVDPTRIHFTDPLRHEYLTAASRSGRGYILGSTNKTYVYTAKGRDMIETMKSCIPVDDDDVSGNLHQDVDCNLTAPEEVHMINHNDKAFSDYAFPAGGYIEYSIEHNISIVPTQFTAKEINGLYLNNHLYNQYEVGTQGDGSVITVW